MEDASLIDTEKKSGKWKKIFLVLLIVVLVASNTALALFYVKQQSELQASIATLKIENTKLKRDLAAANSTSNQEDTTGEWREIPELGVKYKVTDDTKDLVYGYLGATDIYSTVGFSSVQLVNSGESNKEKFEKSDPESAKGINGQPCTLSDPPAMITRLSQKPGEGSDAVFIGSKKIGKYYYAYAYDKLNGSTKCNQDQFSQVTDSIKTVFDSLEAI